MNTNAKASRSRRSMEASSPATLRGRGQGDRNQASLFEKCIGKKGSGLGQAVERPELHDCQVGGPSDEWMTSEEAAAYLKLSLGSLRNATSNDLIPSTKIGRRVRYSRIALSMLFVANAKGRYHGN